MQKKILVAVDDSTPSRQAVEYAGRVGGIIQELGVTLFHVQPPISQFLLDEAKGANCDGALSVELTPGATPDRVGSAQFTLLDFKRIVSAARIDGDALAAELNERNPPPRATTPKL